MLILISIALISFIFGLLFLFNIKLLEKLEALLNKAFFSTVELTQKHHRLLGVGLIIFSLFLCSIAFRLRR